MRENCVKTAKRLHQLRQWINRNDGRYVQVDNIRYSAPQAIGLLLLTAGIILSANLIPHLTISLWFSLAVMAIGVLLLTTDFFRKKK